MRIIMKMRTLVIIFHFSWKIKGFKMCPIYIISCCNPELIIIISFVTTSYKNFLAENLDFKPFLYTSELLMVEENKRNK